MSGLGDHAGEMIYILLAILLIVAVMVAVMTLSKISKKSTNAKVNDLNKQVGNVDNQFYEDWDMGTINGAQLKILMQQARDKDCAMLVATLGLLGVEPMMDGVTVDGVAEGSVGKAETTFNGNALLESYDAQVPFVKVSLADGNNPHKVTNGAFNVKTSLGTVVRTPALVNYGAILNNAVTESGKDGEKYTSVLKTTPTGSDKDGSYKTIVLSTKTYDDTTDKAQEIAYRGGRFYTKLDLATSQSGEVLRYDNTTDWSSKGKTMYIDDNAQFKSYILCNQAGDYMGLVFVQKQH